MSIINYEEDGAVGVVTLAKPPHKCRSLWIRANGGTTAVWQHYAADDAAFRGTDPFQSGIERDNAKIE